MNDRRPDGGIERPQSAGATVLGVRRARPGLEAEFEVFLDRLRATLQAFPGAQDVTVVRPAAPSRDYLLLYRFDNGHSLGRWRRSSQRQALTDQSAHLTEQPPLERNINGTGGWFTLPGGEVVRPPARWKTWLLTMSALYPLLTVLVLLADAGLVRLPVPLRFALLVPVVTALMTWVVMPVLTQLAAPWLYRHRPARS